MNCKKVYNAVFPEFTLRGTLIYDLFVLETAEMFFKIFQLEKVHVFRLTKNCHHSPSRACCTLSSSAHCWVFDTNGAMMSEEFVYLHVAGKLNE